MSYHEKRRHWKMEMNKRLRGTKVPPRPLSFIVQKPISTNIRGNDQYYVTYSPQYKIYQVSRKPPSNLYTTKKDPLPDSM